MSDTARLRVSDADREQLAGELREHMLAGRLSSEEFEDRLGSAYRASTRGELDEIRQDLPMSPAALAGYVGARKRKLRRRLAQEAGGGVSASAVCVAIWLGDGAHGSFWPAWVIIATLLPLARNGWQLIGPGADPDAVEAALRARRDRRIARAARHTRRGLPR